MSPERFKQHLGELVCYGFVVFPSSEFEILDVYETEGNCCSEFRILSQHDVVKWNLQKRLGGLPAPLASLSWLCIGDARLKHGWNWEAKFDGKRYRSVQKFQVRELL